MDSDHDAHRGEASDGRDRPTSSAGPSSPTSR